MGVHEYGEGERHQPELQQRRRPRQIHQRPAPHRRSDQRNGTLHQRHEQREDEGEMADLYEHVNQLYPDTDLKPVPRRFANSLQFDRIVHLPRTLPNL